MDLNASAPGYGMVIVGTTPNIRVLDLAEHRVLWAGFQY